MKGLLTSDLNDESVIIKDNWFQVFSVNSNNLMSYNYTKFTFGVPSKITEIKSIDGPFYDWKTHFEFQVQSSGKAPMKVHVVMNECNVLHSFFDPKVKVGTLGNDLLSPMLRLCESLCQNNECPVESIISIFQSQAFRGQHEETAENRVFIKCNGDTISGGQEFCGILANMSVNGIPEWGIDKLTLPI